MFCPKCGWDVFENTVGGYYKICVYCGAYTYHVNSKRAESIKEKEMIVDSEEAARLREEYNRSDERRLASERNLQKHRLYIEEERKKDKDLQDMMKKIGEGKMWGGEPFFKKEDLDELKKR